MLKKIKKAILDNSSVLFSKNYPKDFLEEILDLYLIELPFYYNDKVFYSLKNWEGSIFLSQGIIFSPISPTMFIYPILHAYTVAKKKNREVVGISSENLENKLLGKLRKYGYIEKEKEVYQLCIVDKRNLFVGIPKEETIGLPYTKGVISPLVRISFNIEILPFWIEINCKPNSSLEDCNNLIEIALNLKGIVAVYGNQSQLEYLKMLYGNFSTDLQKFVSYSFSLKKLEQVYEKYKTKDYKVIFNPWGLELSPLSCS